MAPKNEKADEKAIDRVRLPDSAELSWHEEGLVWYADADGETGAYTCEMTDDEPEKPWFAQGPDGELGTAEDLDGAQALCQAHYDGALRPAKPEQLVKADPDGKKRRAKAGKLGWRKVKDGVWTSTKGTGYGIELTGEQMRCSTAGYAWQQEVPPPEDVEAGSIKHLGAAKAVCQEHYEAQAEKPSPGELGDWLIPAKLSEQELGALKGKIADYYEEIRAEEGAIESVKARAREQVKEHQLEIDGLKKKADELAEQRKKGHGKEKPTRCHRRIEGDEVIFTCPTTGRELHRRPKLLEQQELPTDDAQERARPAMERVQWLGARSGWVGVALPKPYDTTREREDVGLFAAAGGQRAKLIAELLARPWPELPERMTNWPWCEPSWHPLVLRCQVGVQMLLCEHTAKAWRERWFLEAAPELQFRELVKGVPTQLISEDGAYQVRRETRSRGIGRSHRTVWIALHGEHELPDKDETTEYASPEAATRRCRDHAAAMGGVADRVLGARALHEEHKKQMKAPPKTLDEAIDRAVAERAVMDREERDTKKPPLKWRKSRGTPSWTAGEHLISAAKPGKLQLRYAMFELGELLTAGEFPTKAELQAAKAKCERLAMNPGSNSYAAEDRP